MHGAILARVLLPCGFLSLHAAAIGAAKALGLM